MFASLQRFDRNLDVPMVGRRDTHDINIIAIEQFAIIAVDIRFAISDFLVTGRALGMATVDVGNGNDISELGVTFAITRAHSTKSDPSDQRPVVLGFVCERLLRPREISDRR
jgi:hypothetical protein